MTEEKAHHQGHRARLRERLLRDATSLADYEILELVLGLVQLRRDTKPLAKTLLERFESIQGVLNAHPNELAQVPGFSAGTHALWSLLREFMARYAESPLRRREVISSPQQVADIARVRLAGCPHEEIWAAFLDTGNRLLAWERLAQGTVNASTLHIRTMLEYALTRKASGIILVHNHPGGSTKPSGADIELTRAAYEAAKTVNLRLLDHLVLTESGSYSFKDQGLLG